MRNITEIKRLGNTAENKQRVIPRSGIVVFDATSHTQLKKCVTVNPYSSVAERLHIPLLTNQIPRIENNHDEGEQKTSSSAEIALAGEPPKPAAGSGTGGFDGGKYTNAINGFFEPGDEEPEEFSDMGHDGSRKLLTVGELVRTVYRNIKRFEHDPGYAAEVAFWISQLTVLFNGADNGQITREQVIATSASLLAVQTMTSEIDGKTGIYNWYAFEKKATPLIRRAQISGDPLSFLTIDIDHFKPINDEYGHLTGDAVLRGIARHWQEHLRPNDLFGRVGGEEFSAIIAATEGDAGNIAARISESLPAAIRKSAKKEGYPVERDITASIGIIQIRPHSTLISLQRETDAMMYVAKAMGRDKIITSWDMALIEKIRRGDTPENMTQEIA